MLWVDPCDISMCPTTFFYTVILSAIQMVVLVIQMYTNGILKVASAWCTQDFIVKWLSIENKMSHLKNKTVTIRTEKGNFLIAPWLQIPISMFCNYPVVTSM